MKREIEIKDLCKFINPITLEDWPAIAVATDGKETNGLTIGWAEYGVLWGKPASTVYVHKTRYSKHIFDGADYYSVCYLKPEHKENIKYFGTVSGKDENKIAKGGLTITTDDYAPYFKETDVVVICKVMGRSDFNPDSVAGNVQAWYKKEGVHTLYYGEIIKVLVEE